MTPYTGYPDVQGIIYQDELSRNRLMRTDELHKFSDGTLNNKAQRSKVDAQLGEVCRRKTTLVSFLTEITGISIDFLTPRKMEILLESTSNKLMVVTHWFTLIVLSALRRSDNENMLSRSSRIQRILKDGGEDKEFQRSFRHSDTERLSRSDEVLKLKNFKKDATLKLFKSTNQERYEHVGPEVTSSQDGKTY
ncbi:hypothetical protein Tco_1417395 [Tanacetum coccineum]